MKDLKTIVPYTFPADGSGYDDDKFAILKINSNFTDTKEAIENNESRIGELESEIGKDVDLSFFDGNGVVEGMTLSIDTDTTKFKISAGKYHKIGEKTNVVFDLISEIDVTNIATHLVTYVGIDTETGDILQKTDPFTHVERRSVILLGVIVHSNLTIINAVNNLPDVAVNSLSQYNDLLDSLSFFNEHGNKILPNGSNLKIDKTEGCLFKKGVNFVNNTSSPHLIELSVLTSPSNIRHRMSDGTEYGNTDVLDLYYESAIGVKTIIPSNKFSIFRVVIFSSNLIRIQYGRAIYSNMKDAIDGIFTETFTFEQNISQNALLRCLLIVRGGTTDLSDTTRAKFIETDRFGQMPVGGYGGTTSLQEAYNNSVIPNITTNEILKAVSIRRGSDNETDNVFEVRNGDNAIVEKITGEGFKSIRYRDEYVGGEWVNPTGGTPPDDVSVTIGGVLFRMKSFDGINTTEWFANSFEMAHDLAFDELNAGTVKMEVHTHFMPSDNGSGAVKWFFDYAYLPTTLAPIAQNTISMINTFAINKQHFHMLAGVELPIPAGGFKIGDIILFNIRRTPTDVEDTYGSDALFIKCALHVPTNDFGSRQRYIK